MKNKSNVVVVVALALSLSTVAQQQGQTPPGGTPPTFPPDTSAPKPTSKADSEKSTLPLTSKELKIQIVKKLQTQSGLTSRNIHVKVSRDTTHSRSPDRISRDSPDRRAPLPLTLLAVTTCVKVVPLSRLFRHCSVDQMRNETVNVHWNGVAQKVVPIAKPKRTMSDSGIAAAQQSEGEKSGLRSRPKPPLSTLSTMQPEVDC